MSKCRILVVDDEPSVLEIHSEYLLKSGYEVTTASDGTTALELAREGDFDVAVVDLLMPGITGMDTVRQLKELAPDTEAIILTGIPSLETSLEAIREKVFDYLCKPLEMAKLAYVVSRACERRQLIKDNRELIGQLENERQRLQNEVTAAKRALENRLSSSPIFVGESPPISEVRRFISEVAPSDMTVLIRGESGTGKDIVARLIHSASGRGVKGAFVKINCPAIPESLLESELFGHEVGAFTGADRRKPGRFELAAGGTVFLDEIGEIPPALQVKLLQVIEHKQFTRLGGQETIRVDARIVAATNSLLEEMIKSDRFRSDLFYRLNEFCIHLPPLRERKEDIPLLVQTFLRKYGQEYNREQQNLSPLLMSKLMQNTWPGNVRELEAVVRRYILTGREESILPSLIQSAPEEPTKPKTDKLRETEIETIRSALINAHWNRRKAATLLGVSYSTLRRKISKYNLQD
jgi:DNA-binding NtrC family response regulator